MANNKDEINVAEAIFRPGDFFKTPDEVLKVKNISNQDKVLILRTWRYDVLLQEVAMEENMPQEKTGPDLLQDIDKALISLGVLDIPGTGAPTKFG